MEIFDDLESELDRLEAILEVLDDEAWASPSAAPGWTIADVVLHLAQTEEMVVASAGHPLAEAEWRHRTESIDVAMEEWVRRERSAPAEVLDRWRHARRAALAALRAADPSARLAWAEAPLKPATLATTRLAEHWAHALDITDPLGIAYPDTDRLRHIAWLGHSTLPYAFRLAGLEPQPVRCELTCPSGAPWCAGPIDAESVISGPMGAFCRVGAQRLAAANSGLEAVGPHARAALEVLRNYAG